MERNQKLLATKQDLKNLCRDLPPDEAKKVLHGLRGDDIKRLGVTSADICRLGKEIGSRRRRDDGRKGRIREIHRALAEAEQKIEDLRSRISRKTDDIRSLHRELKEVRAEWKRLDGERRGKEI